MLYNKDILFYINKVLSVLTQLKSLKPVPTPGFFYNMARKSLERQMQIRVYQWFICQYPKYNKLCTHPPNGGRRDVREAALFKKMGVLAGVPDLVFFIAKGGYHGLFIEFKLPGEKLSSHQREVIKSLRAQDYKVEICYSDLDAIEIIKNYIENN